VYELEQRVNSHWLYSHLGQIPSAKYPPVPIVQKADWDQVSVWVLWERKKGLPPDYN